MAEPKETGEKIVPVRAFREVVDRIGKRVQPQFRRKLSAYEALTSWAENLSGFYLAQWCFPFCTRWKLFELDCGLSGGAYKKRVITGCVFERAIYDVVMEEVKRFASSINATEIDITKDFG